MPDHSAWPATLQGRRDDRPALTRHARSNHDAELINVTPEPSFAWDTGAACRKAYGSHAEHARPQCKLECFYAAVLLSTRSVGDAMQARRNQLL